MGARHKVSSFLTTARGFFFVVCFYLSSLGIAVLLVTANSDSNSCSLLSGNWCSRAAASSPRRLVEDGFQFPEWAAAAQNLVDRWRVPGSVKPE
jgi:hypothetical protein